MLPDLLARRTATSSPTRSSCRASLLDAARRVPSYYLRYYYAHDEVLAEQLAGAVPAPHAVPPSSASCSRSTPTRRSTRSPALLEQRGGAFYSEAAVDLLASAERDRGDVQVVNVRNDGTLPFLPDDHVDRGAGAASARRASTRAAGRRRSPTTLAGLIAHVAGYERLALDAAVHGGRDRVSAPCWRTRWSASTTGPSG